MEGNGCDGREPAIKARHKRKREEEATEKKRTVNSFIDELVDCSDRGDNILDKLRTKQDFSYKPRHDEEFQKMMYLIERHSSQFPSKLRNEGMDIVKEKAESLGPQDRSREIYRMFCFCVVKVLYGQRLSGDNNWGLCPYEGLDVDVDTEDQVELAIRLCPDVTELVDSYEDGCLVHTLTNSTKSTPFIPFFVGMSSIFRPDMGSLSCWLLNNDGRYITQWARDEDIFILSSEHDDTLNPTPERDEASLAALVNLREKGYLPNYLLRRIVARFLCMTMTPWNVVIDDERSKRSFAFVERRLQLLVEWDPTLLKPEDCRSSPLLSKLHDRSRRLDPRYYQLMLELTLQHFPKEAMGFAFHAQNFRCACNVFGEEPAKQARNNKIASMLSTNGNKAVLVWMIKAATDDSIDLQDLYSIVRFDPSVIKLGVKGNI